MDIGNSFDGKEYTSYMTLPFNFLKSPHRVKKFRKMSINIDAHSFAEVRYSADFSFGSKNNPKDTGVSSVERSSGVWNDDLWSNFYYGNGFSSYLEGYVNGHGENISITVTTTSKNTEPYTLKDISFIYQYQRIDH